MSFLSDFHSIAESWESVAKSVASVAESLTQSGTVVAPVLESLEKSVASVAADFHRWTIYATGEPVGLEVNFSPPTVRENSPMATVKLVKKSAMKAAAKPGAKAAPATFNIVDNGDDTFTVGGVDAGGNPVALASPPVTITCVSDNTSVLTVDPPVGVGSAIHAVGPVGSANLTIVATWSDSSDGPFTIVQPVTVTGGAAAGLTITFGVPTIH